MFNIQNFRQAVLAGIGAVILTATTVGAAVGPARAVETMSAAQLSGQAGA